MYPQKLASSPTFDATRLRVAFAGAGRMARLHLRALRRTSTPHAVIAVYDTDHAAGQGFAALSGGRPYPSLDALLAQGRPDVVHICTPAETHFKLACQALRAGASVYVEKPFVSTASEADELLALATKQGTVVCAGHQLVRQRAACALMKKAEQLTPISLIDTKFTFRPPNIGVHRLGPRAEAKLLLDILPHPLSVVVALLERFDGDLSTVTIESLVATGLDVHAVITKGDLCGRLWVSLGGRPIASTLVASGAGGTYTADLMRDTFVGAGNPGTNWLEKAANPVLEAAQAQARTVWSLARRAMRAGDYPGLSELLADFYRAAAGNSSWPLSPAHLRAVAILYEEISIRLLDSVGRRTGGLEPRSIHTRPVAVLTGAGGFFGREIARQLDSRGFFVRGISRSIDPDNPNVHEWRRLDLSRSLDEEAFRGAAVVVHAAAETMGGFDAQQRNSIDATSNVLEAMHRAHVGRLVYISSMSVLRVPKGSHDIQNESTPLAEDARSLGPYAWGKCMAEAIVVSKARKLAIDAKIIRPGSLIDPELPEVPAVMGRRLFGRWHVALGRPSLPIGACYLTEAAKIVAWCAHRVEQAPPVLNLNDENVGTRGKLVEDLRTKGWKGRVLWLPIPLVAVLLMVVRGGLSLARLQKPTRLSIWSLLKPRQRDFTLATQVLSNVSHEAERQLTALPPSTDE